jgi:DNA-binding transcriptional MerR regulator
MKRYMSIQEVSDRTGLPKSTLRYWEKEFNGIISPERTPGGQRRYRQSHIGLFQKIKMFKQDGKSIQEIKHLVSGHSNAATGYQDADCASVEMLAGRIAALVSEEVSRFLSRQEHNVQTKTEVAE